MPTKAEIEEFSTLIEELAIYLKCTRIEAIVQQCKDTGLEVEIAATLLSAALKSKIQKEAEDSNMIKKTARLPV